MENRLTIVGAGLAGSEAAWQAAQRGVDVVLYEMRPQTSTPAHKTGLCAELVCSNSLGNKQEGAAPFLLKEELQKFESLIISAGHKASVPAGAALAVDRDIFSKEITRALEEHPRVTIVREELKEIPDEGPVIIATGPLTSPALADSIASLIGENYLYFYDAISPIIDAASIDYEKAFFASRYDKGDADYLNCPLSKEQYENFIRELKAAEKVPFQTFEKPVYFEGCMPVEVLAERGDKTLSFGPMKPVGLNHPETGERFYAVVQLRKENREGTAFNMVGFQTKLKYPEQKRIFSMIPGLENAEFFRLGAIHRNTFINAPSLLGRELSLNTHPRLYFAGQMIGVEGYVESCALGLLASLSAVRRLQGELFIPPPPETALGALYHFVTDKKKTKYQPMNINFGLFPALKERVRDKKTRNLKITERARAALQDWIDKIS